jgi:hypothetical protein
MAGECGTRDSGFVVEAAGQWDHPPDTLMRAFDLSPAPQPNVTMCANKRRISA